MQRAGQMGSLEAAERTTSAVVWGGRMGWGTAPLCNLGQHLTHLTAWNQVLLPVGIRDSQNAGKSGGEGRKVSSPSSPGTASYQARALRVSSGPRTHQGVAPRHPHCGEARLGAGTKGALSGEARHPSISWASLASSCGPRPAGRGRGET